MNPHFTFNALGSIQNLINQKKDKEANDYLVNFAKLLRLVLSTSEKRLITLSEEIEQLELYLRLEQLRVPFRYTIDIDESIDVENEEIPGMLIQPIVENAVKHGVVPEGGGHIKLTFTMTGQVLYVTVTDTGNGYFVSEDAAKAGFGLQAIRERLKLLNKELKLEIGLQIENIETDRKITGCKVTISIPV
jgi:LytS/YehU family sensor histidine kinase